jgi:hypothetical protein
MTQPVQPSRNRGRGKNGDIPAKSSQRSKGEVIRVRVRHKNGIYARQILQWYSRSADPRQEQPERGIKVGIGEKRLPTDLN